MATEKMKTLNIKGKNYVTVNERLKAFRTLPDYKGWTLRTIAHELTHDVCTMEAQILDPTGRIVANGFAHELRTQPGSMVNATSHIENCETSAWGRALGNLGIGIDESICSAQELLVAVGMQNSQPAQAAPAAPVQQKGGAIYPAKDPASEAAQDDYTGILADIQSVETYNDLIALMRSERVQTSPYKESLLRSGHGYAKRKGWE